ncbi:hypothetical protein BGZ57DRAFT_915374 [Hyaloscypha finlandica]|nr:hypothetical protein BGZ57DRAFT_915374 [Hyaloscypha finlandica]
MINVVSSLPIYDLNSTSKLNMPGSQEHMEESATENRSNLVIAERSPPNLLDPQPIVEVHVTSPEGQTQSFKIHKNFICYYSPFFDTAFNSKSIEGENQVPELDDTPHEVFGIFVNWLYMQTIKIESDCECSIRCMLLVNVWLLADRVKVPRLQKEALFMLDYGGARNREFQPSQYQRIYRNTTQDSPLRACIVELWPDRTISNSELYPRELLVDLVNRLGPRKRKLEEERFRGVFDEIDAFGDFGQPIAEETRFSPDMLEAPQEGKTKRKLGHTGFAEENIRGSIAFGD